MKSDDMKSGEMAPVARRERRPHNAKSGLIKNLLFSVYPLALFFVVMFAQPGHAQTGDWSQILAAAKKEGRVTLYTSQVPFVVDRLVKGFKSAYPEIQIEVFRQSSSNLVTRLDQERAGNLDGGDVYIGTELIWIRKLSDEGQLGKLEGPATANWPSKYHHGNGYVAGVEPIVIIYNTDLVKTPLTGYADLINPAFRGKIAINELTAIVTLGWYDWLEKQQGKEFFLKLKELNPKVYTLVTGSQAVAAGELAIEIFSNPTSAKPMIAQGAPVAFVVPRPGFSFQYGLAALGWSKRPNAAKVLANFLLSQEGQTLWHGGGESASPIPGIPGGLNIADFTPFEPGDYSPELVRERTQYWNAFLR